MRVVLFVVLREGLSLDDKLTKTIRSTMRANGEAVNNTKALAYFANLAELAS